jgi:membrane protease YdiL (CAAX protease family)
MIKKWLREVIGLWLTLPLAAGLWYIIFALEAGNFWVKISLSAALLAVTAVIFDPGRLQQQFSFRKSHLVIGVLSALLLYIIFWLGNLILTLLFQSARASISSVYAPKQGLPVWGIALLLLCVTSPAEEIFWRGFIQRMLMQKMDPTIGFLLAVLCYTGVHLWTLNIPLILAAFTAGLFWGLLYIHQKSLIPVIISHALWSVIVFIVLPFD